MATECCSRSYSPDGRYLATASFDKTARIWDAHTGAQLVVFSGHDQIVTAAAYSPDGAYLVTASYDKSARIWDAQTGALLRVLSGHTGPLQTVGYSPDGNRIVTAGEDRTCVFGMRIRACSSRVCRPWRLRTIRSLLAQWSTNRHRFSG